MYLIAQILLASMIAAAQTAEENRAKLITGQTKKDTFQLTVKLRGKNLKLKGSEQNEMEARIEIPFEREELNPRTYNPFQDSERPPDTITVTGTTEVLVLMAKSNAAIATTEELRTQMRERNGDSWVKQSHSSLALEPLGSKNESWHGSLSDRGTVGGAGEFVLPLVLSASTGMYSGDSERKSILVGAQFEVSTYYDTPAGDLLDRDIAVRVKTWYPYNVDWNGGGKRTPSGRAIFIKISEANNRSKTHLRREIQINIPFDMTDAEVNSIVKAAMKELDIKAPKAAIVTKEALLNRRLTMHLRYDQAETDQEMDWHYTATRAGFVTFDSLPAKTAAAFDLQKLDEDMFNTKKAAHQVEVEILPEHQHLFSGKNAKTREMLFEQIAVALNGKLSKEPKHVTCARMLLAGRKRQR